MEIAKDSEDAGVVLRVSGEMDVETAYRVPDDVAAEVGEHTDGRPRHVTIDLSEVTFIDSVGLSMLLRSEEEARRNDVPLVLRRPSESVRRLLEITATDRNFAISDDA